MRKKENHNEENKTAQVIAMIPVYLLYITLGANSAFVSVLTPQLREDCSEFSITFDQESWIVSLDFLFSPILCIFSGPLQHIIGPRCSIQLSCLPYLLGWLMTIFSFNYKMLYVARTLVGIGTALLSTSIYSVEVLSIELRGPLTAVNNAFRGLGGICMFVLGIYFRWTTIAKIAVAIPVITLLVSFTIPESPIYLIYRKKEDLAEKSMKRLYGENYDTTTRINQIKDNLTSIMNNGGKRLDYLKKFNKHPELYKPAIIILLFIFTQVFSLTDVLRGYVVKIFDEVFDNVETVAANNVTESDIMTNGNSTSCVKINTVSHMAYISGIATDSTRILASLCLARLLVKFKRRTLYIGSMILSVLGLLLFSLFSFLADQTGQKVFGWLSLMSMILLVAAIDLGVQGLAQLMSGEIFPSDIRVICKGIYRAVLTVFVLISLKLFPSIIYTISMSATFLMFGVLLAMFLPPLWILLPETKGLDLETIQKNFMRRRSFSVDSAASADSGCHSVTASDSDVEIPNDSDELKNETPNKSDCFEPRKSDKEMEVDMDVDEAYRSDAEVNENEVNS